MWLRLGIKVECALLSPEESVCVLGWKHDVNPVMTFPIKRRINTELYIDRTAAF